MVVGDLSDSAIATIVSGAITITTMVVGFFTMWVKLKYGEKKIDDNTAITKDGAVKAGEAKVAAQAVNQKLNGGIDAAIETALKPVRDTLQDHVLQDDQNMKEIRAALEDLHRAVKTGK